MARLVSAEAQAPPHRMTTGQLAATCIFLAVVLACLAPHMGRYQIEFMNNYWKTRFTERAARLYTLGSYIISAGLVLVGVGLLAFDQ